MIQQAILINVAKPSYKSELTLQDQRLIILHWDTDASLPF